jgi:hypothetical protein
LFEQAGTDANGYPITSLVDGSPVVQDVVVYDMPYLKDEVISLIHWIQNNK